MNNYIRYNAKYDTQAPDYEHEPEQAEEDVREEADERAAQANEVRKPINRVLGGQSWEHTAVPLRHPAGRNLRRAVNVYGPHPNSDAGPVENEASKPQ